MSIPTGAGRKADRRQLLIAVPGRWVLPARRQKVLRRQRVWPHSPTTNSAAGPCCQWCRVAGQQTNPARRDKAERSTGVDAEMSLAWLLQPLSVETFLDEIWGKDHHHSTSVGSFDALLPGSSTVDGLLELFRHEPSALRLVRGKDKKGPDSYRLADGTLDVASVRTAFFTGSTITSRAAGHKS